MATGTKARERDAFFLAVVLGAFVGVVVSSASKPSLAPAALAWQFIIALSITTPTALLMRLIALRLIPEQGLTRRAKVLISALSAVMVVALALIL